MCVSALEIPPKIPYYRNIVNKYVIKIKILNKV